MAKKFSNPASLFPSLKVDQGTTYFMDAFKRINRMKVFPILSWMPKSKKPIFLLTCLRHLIKKLHELSSVWNPLVLPCPLDQISITCPNSILKISFFFHCHLLKQHWRFLRPKAVKKILQSCLHTQKNLYYLLFRCVPHKCRCISFP